MLSNGCVVKRGRFFAPVALYRGGRAIYRPVILRASQGRFCANTRVILQRVCNAFAAKNFTNTFQVSIFAAKTNQATNENQVL